MRSNHLGSKLKGYMMILSYDANTANDYPFRRKYYVISMSAQIMKSKKGYYTVLESTQKGSLDVSQWLVWNFECLTGALEAIVIEKGILSDSGFYNKYDWF
jgi:hypothetical protein